jgi:hypothetical protein
MHRPPFILALSLCAFVLPARADNEEFIANTKTIGIISALGDKLHNVYVGTTVFTNEQVSADITEWKLDDIVFAEFKAALAGRFDVKAMNYNKEDFVAVWREFPGGEVFDIESRIKTALPADGSPGYDAYLVIRNIRNGDFVGSSNQALYGPGLYRRHKPLGGDTDGVFISCNVTLVDGRTGKDLDHIVFAVPGGSGLFFDRSPAHRVVENMWGEAFAMTPEARAQVLAEMKALIREGAALSVQRLDLMPKK